MLFGKKKKIEDAEMSFLGHLEQLRVHIIRSVVAAVMAAAVVFGFKNFFFDVVLLSPTKAHFVTYELFCAFSKLWEGEVFCMEEMPFRIVNLKMAGQFAMHLWVSLVGGVILAFPYIVLQIWLFVAPGLKPEERKYAGVLIGSSSILFFLGVLFGYFLIVPLTVQFLGTYQVSDSVANQIDLSSYISTVTSVLLACGVMFQLPVLVYVGSKLGLLTPEWMRKYRKHAFVVVLIVAAVITPPDVASQILVTIPVMILYEISILIASRISKRQTLR
ncbi:twin-arginine translocase subunit TatC [Thermaurantimonas aggregans]|uniref:twin-arginine translocase subunit TatC n=1 Tax=Thermaurantimonas aggregans TaxID=2173829 RepID=UPI000F58E23B|nr:twin-arginine translocase subunit TatC [Thermaurantimonas aggregans]MCX8148687.1 twin-arginine translocase subunit TatC [Thermaurantimonas aggregans]